MFDLCVVENGAMLYDPKTQEETVLAPDPPEKFIQRLVELEIRPLSIGRSIIATREPNEAIVLEVIRELGLEYSVIFNKGAVMVLPANVNKATGLLAALERMKLSPHNVAGIGDAENDHAFLSICGVGVAVGNALLSLKERVDLIVDRHGRGVVELVNFMIESDLRHSEFIPPRNKPEIGKSAGDLPVHLDAFGTTLITGSSGSGKSTIVRALLEQARQMDFQCLVIDAEGDYADTDGPTIVGNAKREPEIAEIMDALEKPQESVIADLTAVDPTDRPRFFSKLLPEISRLRAETGRPHWVFLEEAHHFLPADAKQLLPQELPALVAITVHPEALASDMSKRVSTIIGVGKGARKSIEAARRSVMDVADLYPGDDPADDDHILVARSGSMYAELIQAAKPKEKRALQARKYAEGELAEDESFYFRGPEGRLNLRAQNLSIFKQLARGIDDETWLHHLRAADYSKWFRTGINDEELAQEAADIESAANTETASESRRLIIEAVERKYTASA
jgi:hydroxymethylpyrimidine pyrophosphatase-like HAD family hydrolase/energy-coupling factor transporter ATP-binding protein EcfA2